MTIFEEARRWLRELKNADSTYAPAVEILETLGGNYRSLKRPFDEKDPYVQRILKRYRDDLYHASIYVGTVSLPVAYLLDRMYDFKMGIPEQDPKRLFLPYHIRFYEDSGQLSVTAIYHKDAMAAIDTTLKNISLLPVHIREQCHVVKDSTGQEYYQWAILNNKDDPSKNIIELLQVIFAPEKDGDTAPHNAFLSTGLVDSGGNFIPEEPYIYSSNSEPGETLKRLTERNALGIRAIRVKKIPETMRIMRNMLGIDLDKGPDKPGRKGGR